MWVLIVIKKLSEMAVFFCGRVKNSLTSIFNALVILLTLLIEVFGIPRFCAIVSHSITSKQLQIKFFLFLLMKNIISVALLLIFMEKQEWFII